MDSKIRLLLVEDDATLAGVISDVLSESGFDVLLAKNGAEALDLLVPEDRSTAGISAPEIIVTDIMMPKMDGFTMVRSLREKGCDTPVLFLSARTSAEDVIKGFHLGAGDYIRKPFAMKELIVRIHSLLNRHSAAGNTGASAPIATSGQSCRTIATDTDKPIPDLPSPVPGTQSCRTTTTNADRPASGTMDSRAAEPYYSTSAAGSIERTSGAPPENHTAAPLPGTAENPFRIGRYRFDSVHRRLWLVAETAPAPADSTLATATDISGTAGGDTAYDVRDITRSYGPARVAPPVTESYSSIAGKNKSVSDQTGHSLSCIQLPTMESEILDILCRRMGTVVPNSFILKKLWGHDDYFSTRSLNVHITRLRKRLQADPSVSIDSFRGNGYRLSV